MGNGNEAGKRIKLSDHFTYGRLIRFTLPSIAMMIFTSIYGVVDGFFVSNYAGETPFASLNLILPFIMMLAAVGFMFGAGGSALVSMILGMGDREKANEVFSLIVYTLIAIGVVFSIAGAVAAEPVARALGATEEMVPYCVIYTRISMISLTMFMLQSAFQSLMITAERPKMGLYVTIAAGVTNMVLDWLFMGVLGMGVGSAAAATAVSEYVGGGIPLIYFFSKNSSLLHLGRTKPYFKMLIKAVTNGASEFLSNIAFSFINMMYNYQLMRLAGEKGVSAYGIIMYTGFVFCGVYFGYAMGVSPLIGYNYGAENKKELAGVFRKSMMLILAAALFMTASAELLSGPMAAIFAGYDEELLELTIRAIRIYSISYLFLGFNVFGSALFTALNNGLVSAVISVLRVFAFELIAIMVLPEIIGLDGVWSAAAAAEAAAICVTVFCIWHFRKRYGYIQSVNAAGEAAAGDI
ncbi:MAG: MATE family efflux transporter [Lachnospiraceae bacterium]|nr:MATE family efflux transporter [Lachnospiraceae bacterium]